MYGELGDGTQSDRWTPVDVNSLTSGAAAITIGGWFTCALTTANSVKCWGHNNYGQLGDNTITDHWIPANVNGLTSGVTAIASASFHACALTTSGSVKCWGKNDFGQLGDGSTTDRWTPVDVGGF